MSIIYLYVRNIGSRGTLVTQMTREKATELIKEFKHTNYQVGILSAKDLNTLSMVYGEFAPFKEVNNSMYIINILNEKIKDKILDKSKIANLYDLKDRIVNNNKIDDLIFDK